MKKLAWTCVSGIAILTCGLVMQGSSPALASVSEMTLDDAALSAHRGAGTNKDGVAMDAEVPGNYRCRLGCNNAAYNCGTTVTIINGVPIVTCSDKMTNNPKDECAFWASGPNCEPGDDTICFRYYRCYSVSGGACTSGGVVTSTATSAICD